MLSQTVEYALRATALLASRYPQPQTTQQVADATRVPRAYLSKVLQGLCSAGIVKSRRGLGGGMQLAHRPEQLTILDVVNAVEPMPRIATCPLGLRQHGQKLCPLHRRLDDAIARVEASFAATTLAEILSEPTGSSTFLCE